MCEFRIGQKVVCVDISCAWEKSRWNPATDVPVVGGIYTITGIVMSNVPERHPFELMFAEIHQSRDAKMIDGRRIIGYSAYRFRPLVEPKEDISIFQRMCIDATKRVSAE